MHRGESIPVFGDWFKLTFTENPGMAFGLQIFSRQSMAMLAIVVTVLLLWYLFAVRGGYTPYLASLALVLGGAVGNVIDRTFYGLILGYGRLLEGKVVDFIHVDAWRGYLPEALPVVGGAYLPLFPIWNVADMAIVCGVVGILVFQRRFHRLAFEQPEHDRARLRELEEEREHQLPSSSSAAGGPATGAATQASTESSDVPPTAPSAESPGAAALDADDDDTEDDRSPEKPAGGASDGAAPNGDAASESAAPEPRDASSRTADGTAEAEDRSSSYAPPENSS